MCFKLITIVALAAQIRAGSAFVSPLKHSVASTGIPLSRNSPLYGKNIIDLDSIEKSEGTAFSDGVDPVAMGVSKSSDVVLPADIPVEGKYFEFAPGDTVPPHSHYGAQWNLVSEGGMRVTTKDYSRTYEKGQVYIIPSDVEYELEASQGGAKIIHFWFYRIPEPLPDPDFKQVMDYQNVERSPGTPFRDGSDPSAMGVSLVYDLTMPRELEEKAENKYFIFEEGAKVPRHAHHEGGSSLYVVQSGALKVTTETYTKTYRRGDMFIVPSGVEYELEAVISGGVGYMWYW